MHDKHHRCSCLINGYHHHPHLNHTYLDIHVSPSARTRFPLHHKPIRTPQHHTMRYTTAHSSPYITHSHLPLMSKHHHNRYQIMCVSDPTCWIGFHQAHCPFDMFLLLTSRICDGTSLSHGSLFQLVSSTIARQTPSLFKPDQWLSSSSPPQPHVS